ncbi:WXG100 family type VII secretion target [Ornithinibacillus xuwenensis]|uniref:WXG100 family type VII secretion target n=1 Tax=Ornithinibacillus xuwenensis TaxID=3144668 RepID=A0ABU9XQ58_9BACI
MGDVRIDEGRLNEAKNAAKTLESSLKSTYSQCEDLISFVQSAKWEGKSRDAFITYLEIIYQYHKDLKKAASLQTKALNNLDGYIDDFSKDNSVREVRNL